MKKVFDTIKFKINIGKIIHKLHQQPIYPACFNDNMDYSRCRECPLEKQCHALHKGELWEHGLKLEHS